MKAFNRIFAAMGVALAAVALGACDNIDENNRYLPMPAPPSSDNPDVVVRNVFMEEFTGQRCVNCPAGHAIIERLEEQYGSSRFIAVSIHAGTFAVMESSSSKVVGLGTSEGEQICSRYGISAFPKAVIDGNSGELDMDKWASDTYNQFMLPPAVGIRLTPSYDEATGTITVEASVTNQGSGTYAGTLHLWVVEDGIEAVQLGADGKPIAGYVHNNVFRAWFHSIDGIGFSAAALGSEGDTFTTTARLARKATWTPENLRIVAFTKGAGGAVGNAATVHLLGNDQPGSDEPAEEETAE